MMNDAGDCEVVRKPAQPKPALQCTGGGTGKDLVFVEGCTRW